MSYPSKNPLEHDIVGAQICATISAADIHLAHFHFAFRKQKKVFTNLISIMSYPLHKQEFFHSKVKENFNLPVTRHATL
ncbi:hypothetical protein EB796_003575 [Bugula neritina]|uniref:Uncharacterized protein n=1 Tax=Bugula neritina TaxID=10212 RepID=A0A7J7KHQ7_BUGNE|nr:hypothetical protein EB796_003575 [Bugula neritina]